MELTCHEFNFLTVSQLSRGDKKSGYPASNRIIKKKCKKTRFKKYIVLKNI